MNEQLEGVDGGQEAEPLDELEETKKGAPAAPEPHDGPATDHPHRELWLNVRRALYAIPTFFKTKITIAGIRATDIHSLNSSLGASIEQSVVDQLNELRDIWDPKDPDGARKYQHLAFKRQSANWPDVLLTSGVPDEAPVMGIELKGWFVLAKEGEPSFRYKVNPNVCTDLDLVAVYPWNLDEVLSGTPYLMTPFVAEARYTAEMRNYYWQHSRRSTGNTVIHEARDQGHYPKRGDHFSDEPASDAGKNFGRASRAGIMRNFISTTFDEVVAGIPLNAWNAFFKNFREGLSLTEVTGEIRRRRALLQVDDEQEGDLAQLLRRMLDYVERVSGSEVTDVGGRLHGEGVKLIAVVLAQELRNAFADARNEAEIVVFKAGSLSVAASGDVKYIQGKLNSFDNAAGDGIERVRIEMTMADDGIFRIKTVKAL